MTAIEFRTGLDYFRGEQAIQFSETVTITRPTGEPTFNDVTGVYAQQTTTVYDGPAKVRPNTSTGTTGEDRQAGQTEIRLSDFVVKLPVDTDVAKDDTVTVTASTYDAALDGRSYRVTDAPNDGWQISRVAFAEQVLVPLLNEDG